MSYGDRTSKSYSADWYGEHTGGERIIGPGMAARIGREITEGMIAEARNSGDTPVVHLTGNNYMPPLRSYPGAEYVWQADNGAHSADEFAGPAVWQALVDAMESALQDANVYLGTPDYDNALYVVDMNRWQFRDDADTAEDLNDEWEPRPVLCFPGFPPIRGIGPVIKAIEEEA